MDFKKIKEKALELKKQAEKKRKEAIDYSAKKLAWSGLTISTKEDFKSFVEKSAKTKWQNKETGKVKYFSHRVIIIIWEEKSEFFKKALYQLPVLATKWFTQNTPVKLAKAKITWVDFKEHGVKKAPAIIIFENKKLLKTVSWEENIAKLVKSFDFDINKAIDNM